MNQDTVTISRAEYEELRKANDELRQANEGLSKQVSFLMQQIALARQQCFGSSSEKSKYDDGSEQLSFLFNEIEVYADSSSVVKEPDLTTVKEHKRNRKHLTRETDLPEDIETEVVIRDVPESERIANVKQNFTWGMRTETWTRYPSLPEKSTASEAPNFFCNP